MPSNKERVVLTLGTGAKNELAWIAMKNRTTMSRLVAEYVHNRFVAEVPAGYDPVKALRLVRQDDFDVTSSIPFESTPL